MSQCQRPPKEALIEHVKSGMSDTSIGTLYGVGKMAVYQWRRLYGVPSRHDLLRQTLPSLTDIQHQVLIGSLFGDGSISMASRTKARFGEGHSTEQKEYLEWKAALLHPFVTEVRPRKQYSGTSYYISSLSLEFLVPYFKEWYPTPVDGKWTKSIPKGATLTPLSLAIWYMDDGNLSGRNVSFTFGLDHTSLLHSLGALRQLGFDPSLLGDGEDSGRVVSIRLLDKDMDRFLSFVDEHVPRCMRHKLPCRTSARKTVLDNAKKLTHDVAVTLIDKGFGVPEIASMFGVSENTVDRRLEGDPVYNVGRPREGYSPAVADVYIEDLKVPSYENVPENDRHQYIDKIIDILLHTSFPYQNKPSFHYTKDLVQKLLSGTEPLSHIGNDLCLYHMPHLYGVTKGNRPYSRSVLAAWAQPLQLKEALILLWKDGKNLRCHTVRQTLSYTHRSPTNYRPVAARTLIDQFCPWGGTVYDPCAGWGGRLLGFLASSLGQTYIGVDVAPNTIKALEGLYDSTYRFLDHEKTVQLHCTKAQEFTPDQDVDLVFTSPPYFDAEIYSKHPGQSCIEYKSYSSWLDGFLLQMLKNATARLKPGGHAVLCVADLKDGSGVLRPLVDDTASIFDGLGLIRQPFQDYTLRNKRPETLVIYQKPI